MELRSDNLLNAFPTHFPFYHLGEVREGAGTLDFANVVGVGFSLLGELRGMILVVFDSRLDLPTYTEIGNTLAGKIATHLSCGYGVGVMISPPMMLTASRITKLMAGKKPLIEKIYTHAHHGKDVPILVWALPEIQEEFGNA